MKPRTAPIAARPRPIDVLTLEALLLLLEEDEPVEVLEPAEPVEDAEEPLVLEVGYADPCAFISNSPDSA